MADETQSNVYRRGARGGASQRQTVIVVAFRANQPSEPPSRHVLDEVDCVVFGRGERTAVRDEQGVLRRLSLRVPDPMMSGDHGRLLRTQAKWLLEDDKSKNGAVVAGKPTRCAAVQAGDVFELGHTLFLLDTIDLPGDADPDAFAPDVTPAALGTLHPGLARDVDLLRRVAATDVPLLLQGKTGTGKEVFARALHELSGRRGSYVAVNCGGLVPTLVEAELFGHRRGAFSGAVSDRPGYLRAADGGTLFLDEIGELSPPAQAALLRALQQREVVPVGDTTPIPVDIRVCAATNRDLAASVAAGKFRDDLYARLMGLTITLPPLRERRMDLGLLIASLLRTIPGGPQARFVPEAAYALFRYDWPRNVRELERCLAAAVALAAGAPIGVEHLPVGVAARESPADAAPAPVALVDDPELAATRGTLMELLVKHQGNVAAVARDLGKHREQIHRWVRRLGIDLDSFRK